MVKRQLSQLAASQPPLSDVSPSKAGTDIPLPTSASVSVPVTASQSAEEPPAEPLTTGEIDSALAEPVTAAGLACVLLFEHTRLPS